MAEKPLTAKQAAFADIFDGNGTEACRLAGYKGSDNTLAQQARENLRNPQIAARIKARQEQKVSALIASREERQAFWTGVMRDSGPEMRDRLKASELLGRSEADFIERVAGADGGPVQVSVNINRTVRK